MSTPQPVAPQPVFTASPLVISDRIKALKLEIAAKLDEKKK